MTSDQKNRFNMFMVVFNFLGLNPAIVSTIPFSALFMSTLQNIISQILLYGEQQIFDKKGIAVYKERVRATLISSAIDIARKTAAYASIVGNDTLFNEMDLTETQLKRDDGNNLLEHCKGIYDRSNANAAALVPYGVTAAMITGLQNNIDSFFNTKANPRLGIVEKKKATTELKKLFDMGDAAMKKCDIMIEIVRISQPQFYRSYRDARIIVNTSEHTIALKAQVVDKTTGKPIEEVVCVFTSEGSDTVVRIRKKTAKKGGFMIRNMQAGTYKVAVSMEGYISQVVTVYVTDGLTTELMVQLEKI